MKSCVYYCPDILKFLGRMAVEVGELTKHVGGSGKGGCTSLTGISENSGISLMTLGWEVRGVHLVDYNY